MKAKVKVEIVKSTEKAHLVKSEDGRECWIQKRWLSADSMVNETTFNRGAVSIEERAAEAERRKAATEAARNFKNDLHPVAVARESEKAIACEAEWSVAANDDFGGKRLVWFPKSQVKDNCVPGWLILAKARELAEAVIGGQNHFSVVVNNIGGVGLNEHVVPMGWL